GGVRCHGDVSCHGDDVLAAADGGGAGAGGGTLMDYDAVLAQVLELLQQEQRIAYRILKRRLQLDDETLEDLKDDLIYAKNLAVDEEDRVLVWRGGTRPDKLSEPFFVLYSGIIEQV